MKGNKTKHVFLVATPLVACNNFEDSQRHNEVPHISYVYGFKVFKHDLPKIYLY